MAVYIQCKCRRCVAQIFLHGFHIIAILEGKNSEGMTQIVNAGIRSACCFCNFFVMVIESMRVEVVPQCIGEHQPAGRVLFGCILPVLLCASGQQSARCLLFSDGAKNVHHEWSRMQDARPVILQ